MKLKEMREKESGHLQHELAEQQKHLFTLRTQSVTEKLEDPSQLKKARRDIARLKTLLRQRQIEEMKKAAPEKAAAPAKVEAPEKAVKKAAPKKTAKKSAPKKMAPEKAEAAAK